MKFYVMGRSSNYPKVENAFEKLKSMGHKLFMLLEKKNREVLCSITIRQLIG
tara:strand:- start:306 stop:461 length:156 start_codon:yes stop_codon:yes gene_type:complete